MINPETWCAIHALIADYWLRVDRLSDAPIDELYVENGVMQIGTLRCDGRSQIRSFFLERNIKEQEMKRTTRHASLNVAIYELGSSRLRIRSTVQVIAGIGAWPLLSMPPSTIADFTDIVVRSTDGLWLFESRTTQIVFTGSGAASFAR